MPQPVRVEGQMPVYTQAARERGIEGTVVVLFKVTPSGATSDVRIIKDLPLLGEICSVAVRRWRFRPVVHEGRPVTVVMKQAFVFRLSE
jgi:protein TonB